MKRFTCGHPVLARDPEYGHIVASPGHKCPACRNAEAEAERRQREDVTSPPFVMPDFTSPIPDPSPPPDFNFGGGGGFDGAGSGGTF
jgi:hypothetical protein